MVYDRHFHVRILDQFSCQNKCAQSDKEVGQPYFFMNYPLTAEVFVTLFKLLKYVSSLYEQT